jgi:hypothetical protein
MPQANIFPLAEFIALLWRFLKESMHIAGYITARILSPDPCSFALAEFRVFTAILFVC